MVKLEDVLSAANLRREDLPMCRPAFEGKQNMLCYVHGKIAGFCWTDVKVRIYLCCLIGRGTRRHRIALHSGDGSGANSGFTAS